jgi:hypothetical protein
MRRGTAALAALLVAIPSASRAQPVADPSKELSIEVTPVFASQSAMGKSVPAGWNEMLVIVSNRGARPIRGEVVVSERQVVSKQSNTFTATAPFNAGAGASVHVRVPVEVSAYGELTVDVTSDGVVLSSTRLSTHTPGGVFVVDVSEAARVRGAIGDVPVFPAYTPAAASRGSGPPPAVSVSAPRFDPATGDPVLPDRAALYSAVDAVVMPSDLLTRLSGAELEALAGYVLAGGTLALSIVRPEDVRHPTVSAFAGGSVSIIGASAAVFQELVLPMPRSGPDAKVIPFARNPTDDTLKALAGYAGGNLHGSLFGNTASYGLGEVHFLAFDPARKPALDDPWANARLVELARRGHDRRATQIFRPGAVASTRELPEVRKQLDPNESSRWAIGAASLLLCAYAILAGPLNFSRASKRGKPLRALWYLPLFSLLTFGVVVGIGTIAKGVYGRARHLTLVEAGAGMTQGTARRFRGFYASHAKQLTVRTSDRQSVTATAIVESAVRKDQLMVDREGVRLVRLEALPWQTVVVREDGFASLGEGIALTRDGEADVAVTNRTGRNLRGAILRTDAGAFHYLGRVKDGDKVGSRGAKAMSSWKEGRDWESAVQSPVRAGLLEVRRLRANELGPILDTDAPGLAEAFQAMESAAGESVDWFPAGVPVLIGQLDGGEGRTSDSGLRLESDRLLVRVVGFGGRP